jgi:phosphoenolpyruvate carboxykinase (ATP)
MSAPTMMVPKGNLLKIGIGEYTSIHYQLSPGELVQQTVANGQGKLNNTGALVIKTGEFTGRSPLDKFIVKDSVTENTVHWNNFNLPINEKYFNQLKKKLLAYLSNKDEVWVRDCAACAHPDYRINIRVINENAWSNFICL